MPLKSGSDHATISANIAELVRAGHSQDQAAAIAYKHAGLSKSAEPVPVPPAATARTRTPANIFSVPQPMPSGRPADEAFLDAVVKNWEQFQAKGDPRFPKPPAYLIPQASVGIGHTNDQSLARAYAERSDLPAVGWPSDLKREGKFLTAYFEGVPVKLAEWMNAGAYKTCSAEFYEDYAGLGPCLRRVSILGADIPARKDLGDLPTLVFNPEDASKPNPVAFTEALADFARQHPRRFGVRLPGPGQGRLVTFSETSPTPAPGAASMNPQQQAVVAALQAAGIDVSKLDGAAIDQILKALMPAPAAPPAAGAAAAPPAANAEPSGAQDPIRDPAKKVAANAEPTPPTPDKDKPVQFSEKQLAAAIAAAVAPLQAQLKTLDTQVSGVAAKSTAAERVAARAEIATFVEKQKADGKIHPYELDPKVGPTLIDRLLAMPADPVATFAEGKVSVRAAEMAAIAARPPVAKFAEKIPQPVNPTDPKADVNRLLALTHNGKAAMALADKK